MMMGGTVSTLIGIPVWVTGIARSNKVEDQVDRVQTGCNMRTGSGIYFMIVDHRDPFSGNSSPGIAFSLMF
ncbi:MAG: hypothetical protein P1P82_14945 [Bacteroidales bacterium]|nr:hypothetical protein [Bacteroidales bacterium]MDT8432112.1 hypothetical protein [Bacteroidales bacterium]